MHKEFQKNCDKSRSQLEANQISKYINQIKIFETRIRKRQQLCNKTLQNSQVKACKTHTGTTKKVLEFYKHDSISRQLPYKSLTCKVKDHLGVYHCVLMRLMEVTLRNAFKLFKKGNASIKISQRTFEQLRPKHIRL